MQSTHTQFIQDIEALHRSEKVTCISHLSATSLRWWIISFALKYFPHLTQVYSQFIFFRKCYCSFIASYFQNVNCNKKLSVFSFLYLDWLSCQVLGLCTSYKRLIGIVLLARSGAVLKAQGPSGMQHGPAVRASSQARAGGGRGRGPAPG